MILRMRRSLPDQFVVGSRAEFLKAGNHNSDRIGPFLWARTISASGSDLMATRYFGGREGEHEPCRTCIAGYDVGRATTAPQAAVRPVCVVMIVTARTRDCCRFESDVCIRDELTVFVEN